MKLFLKYLSIHVKSIMQYKVSFILSIVGQFFVALSVFISIWFMFERFNSVNEYSYSQVLICFAIVLMSFSLAEVLFRGFDRFPRMIQSGSFDRVMVRPRNEIFQILGMEMDLARAGRLIQGIIVLIYSIVFSNIIWSFDKIIVLVLMIIGGCAFFSGMFMLYAGFSFYTIQGLEFFNILTDGGREFGKYPLSIYGKRYLKFFTYIIPMACFQYYPFLYLIDTSDNILYGLLPIVSMLFILPCYVVFKIGVRHYKSTGS